MKSYTLTESQLESARDEMLDYARDNTSSATAESLLMSLIWCDWYSDRELEVSFWESVVSLDVDHAVIWSRAAEETLGDLVTTAQKYDNSDFVVFAVVKHLVDHNLRKIDGTMEIVCAGNIFEDVLNEHMSAERHIRDIYFEYDTETRTNALGVSLGIVASINGDQAPCALCEKTYIHTWE